jgi:hypothetical protein
MNNYAFNVLSERKPEVRESRPREYVRQRIADSAAALSRAGVMQARVELVNEALCRLVVLAYEADTDGTLANVDSVTYRLIIPSPWGSVGYKTWKLRQHEARALSRILQTRQQAGKRPPLFTFDAPYWYANMHDYTQLGHAQWYLEKTPITLKEWREAMSKSV